MTLTTERLLKQDAASLAKMSDRDLEDALAGILDLQQADRRENQLLFYRPASPRAAGIHKSKARIVGVGGGNGCLPLDQDVLMADGTWRPLGQVVEGDTVIAADPETGKAVPSEVLKTWRSGKNPVYKITFSDGGWFEATAEHMVPMFLGSGRTTSKGNQKVAHKRRLGDYIEPIMRRGARNPSKRISCISPADIQFTACEALPLPPYTLGAMLGDGSLGKSIKFHNTAPEVLGRLASEVAPLGVTLVQYQGCDYGLTNTGQVASSQRFGRKASRIAAIIDSLGLRNRNSYTKFIPRAAFGKPRARRMELLAGLIDTDGTENSFSSCSLQLAEDFCLLVRSLGGKATLTSRMAMCQNGVSVLTNQVYWRMNEPPPLSLMRKYKPSQRGKEIDYTRRICRSAELSRVTETGDLTVSHAAHCYVTRDFVVVSNSGKTESVLAEVIALATGILPTEYRDDLGAKFRGPVQCRMVVESLTTTLDQAILPKLQWWKWTGVDMPGGARGHWGWIPKACLIDGNWDKSWNAKLRTLRMLCRDPDDPDKILGESSMQFMSHDQDPSDFASGDFHHVIHDEPPRFAIWRENEARTMRVAGRLYLSMTWPDDPTIPVDWIFDSIYDKGVEGPNKAKDIDWFELWTVENQNLNQDAVRTQMSAWDDVTKSVRIFGRPIRFSNRIHPLFTDMPLTWSFQAGKIIVPENGICTETGSSDIVEFCHVQDIRPSLRWPTVFILDPHPRKPHMFMWVQVLPDDDLQVIGEGEVADGVDEVAEYVRNFETSHSLKIADRIMDPNMGASPASSKRDVTWQDEFSDVGLNCALADDSDVGRGRINEYLKPDKVTLRPRLVFARECKTTIFQLKRYVWDNFRRADEKDLKQKAKMKNDDFPTMLKYFLNTAPSFDLLHQGAPVVRYNKGYDSRTRVGTR